jgi:hypothetical protein
METYNIKVKTYKEMDRWMINPNKIRFMNMKLNF